MLNQFCVTLAIALGGTSAVEVQTVDGQRMSGELVQLSNERLMIQSAEGDTQLPLESVVRVRSTETPAATDEAALRVWLTDGSELAASQFVASSAAAQVTLSGKSLEVAPRLVHHLRFRPPSSRLDQQWQEIVDREQQGDTIVIRKSDEVLDYLEGVVEQVDASSVKFQFDGSTVDVARSKLEGIVFYTRVTETLADPICRVRTANGSVLNARRVTVQDGALHVMTTGGLLAPFPIGELQNIDFSHGKIVYLSDLEPISVATTPKLRSAIDASLNELLYRPRRDKSILGGKLRLQYQEGNRRTEEFEKGMALHSHTVIVWRLDSQFRKFLAVAGIDPQVKEFGHVQLIIEGDGKTLFESDVAGQHEPVPIELDVSEVKRLRITVDYGDDIDMSDHLNLCNLRVTK